MSDDNWRPGATIPGTEFRPLAWRALPHPIWHHYDAPCGCCGEPFAPSALSLLVRLETGPALVCEDCHATLAGLVAAEVDDATAYPSE